MGLNFSNACPKKEGTFKTAQKSRLDFFLQMIPDEPQVPGYTVSRRVDVIVWLNIKSKVLPVLPLILR